MNEQSHSDPSKIGYRILDSDGNPVSDWVYPHTHQKPKHFFYDVHELAVPQNYTIFWEDDTPTAEYIVDGELLCFRVPVTDANTKIISQISTLLEELAETNQIDTSIKNPTPEKDCDLMIDAPKVMTIFDAKQFHNEVGVLVKLKRTFKLDTPENFIEGAEHAESVLEAFVGCIDDGKSQVGACYDIPFGNLIIKARCISQEEGLLFLDDALDGSLSLRFPRHQTDSL